MKIKKIKYRKFDEAVIEDLKANPKLQNQYLKTALEEYEKDDDLAALLISLKQIVIAKGGFVVLAKKTGISRQGLYKALSAVNSKPQFHTVKLVLEALECSFSFKIKKAIERPKNLHSHQNLFL